MYQLYHGFFDFIRKNSNQKVVTKSHVCVLFYVERENLFKEVVERIKFGFPK